MITDCAPAWCAQVADGDRLTMVIVVAVAIGALADYRLAGISGSQQVSSTSDGQANTIVSVNIKHVTYEIFGPGGSVGTVNHLDENAQPQRADFSTLAGSCNGQNEAFDAAA